MQCRQTGFSHRKTNSFWSPFEDRAHVCDWNARLVWYSDLLYIRFNLNYINFFITPRTCQILRACVGSNARPRTRRWCGSPWATIAPPSWRTRSSTTRLSRRTLGKRQQVGMREEVDTQVCRVSQVKEQHKFWIWDFLLKGNFHRLFTLLLKIQ